MTISCAVLLLVQAVGGFGAGASPAQAEPTPTQAGAKPSQSGTKPAQADATPAHDRGPVVARVNGAPIYKVDYESAVASFMKGNQIPADAPDEQKKEARKLVLDGLIGSELLFQKAKSLAIEVPASEVDQAITQTRTGLGEQGFDDEMRRRMMTTEDLRGVIRQNLTVQRLIQVQVLDTVTITDVEAKSYYDGHPSEMAKPETLEASHILVRVEPSDPPEKRSAGKAKIEGALKRVRGGEEFATVAKELSEDINASTGGSLGTIRPGQTVAPFEEAAFKLAAGQVSDVVETQFGYHVIKVTARHAAGTAAFAEVKGRIAEFLKQRKSRESIERMVETLRASAKIEIL